MTNWLKWLGMAGAVLVLAACGTLGGGKGGSHAGGGAVVEEPGAAAGTTGTGSTGGGARSQGVELGGRDFVARALHDPQSPLARRTIYFDFDSATVRPEDRKLLEAHAKFLADHPKLRVTLEGHTDERGSREYNLALGDRRARAVQRLLEFMGAAPEQLRTLSYGEEKPADPGHNEAAWAKNRRVEIVYEGY